MYMTETSRKRPLSKREYDPVSYKKNPYRTKAQWQEYNKRMEHNHLMGGKTDYLKKNMNEIKYLQLKKKKE
jgi:hypothetical protein